MDRFDIADVINRKSTLFDMEYLKCPLDLAEMVR